jgi:hypothetical protein
MKKHHSKKQAAEAFGKPLVGDEGVDGSARIKLGFCNWPGCGIPAHNYVDGVDYCPTHETGRLRQIVLCGLPRLRLDKQGRPRDRRWLNKLSRLAGDGYYLTKGKIESRAVKFTHRGASVWFSIDRHPVGRVVRERWAFNLETGRCRRVWHRTIESSYKWNKRGYYECPKCGFALLVSPGRAKCSQCDYVDLHEHSI